MPMTARARLERRPMNMLYMLSLPFVLSLPCFLSLAWLSATDHPFLDIFDLV